MELSCNTETASQKAISITLTGRTKSFMPPLLPLSSQTGGPQTMKKGRPHTGLGKSESCLDVTLSLSYYLR